MYTLMALTGRVGGATARALLSAGRQVRGIVRDKSKAVSWQDAGVELVTAAWEDETALTAAFDHSEGVFAMLPGNFVPEPGFPQAHAIAGAIRRALEAAKPKKVVFLSSVGAHHPTGLGLITQLHILEQAMAGLQIPHAFVRPAWFMENSEWDVAPARENGEIPAFLSPLDRPFPMVATEDIGRLIAETLQQDWTGPRVLELEGPACYSQLDAAQTFSRLLNHPVVAKPVPRETWDALFQQQGMPAGRTAPRIEMLDGFNSGWIDFENAPANEHHRGARTLEQVFSTLISPRL